MKLFSYVLTFDSRGVLVVTVTMSSLLTQGNIVVVKKSWKRCGNLHSKGWNLVV